MARILIVEDERLLAESLSHYLIENEHEVVGKIGSADEVLENVEQTGPELVLMDIQLDGETDGVQAAQRIRDKYDIPVVFMTGRQDTETLARAKKTQPYAYLTKPVNLAELKIAVEMALYKRQCDERVRESREELAKSEELNRSLVVNAPMAIVYLSGEGIIQYANPATATLFGFPKDVPSPFLGRSILELPIIKYDQYITDHFKRLNEGEPLKDLEIVYRSPLTDQVFHLLAAAAPRFDNAGEMVGAVVMFADITSQKKADMALRKSEAQKRAILDGITANLTFINEDMEILWTNRAAAGALGMSPDAVKGRKCYNLCGAHDSPCKGCPAFKTFQTGRTQRGEIITSMNRIMDVTTTAVPGDNGEISGVLAIAEDITDEKRARELVLQAEKYRAIVDLSAGVSHNFNNLLQIIMGNTSVALNNLRSANFPDVEKNLERILKSSELGAQTVKRLNRLSSDAGRVPEGKREVFDLSGLVEQAIEMTRSIWLDAPKAKRIQINLESRLDADCTINGTKSEIFEVILNLISNAVDALPNGGNIMIETSKERDNVVLKVADTGIGIPEENIQRLFTPFFTTSVESGKGLGLATCRTIIEGHGGHIFAENNEDGGALFTLELPFALMTDAHGTKQAEPGAVAPLSILVVDDKVDVLNMLKSGLEMYGHSVRIAPSAGEALEIFDKEPVDAVLCDLSIPDLNGWEVGKIMKNRREGAGRQKIPFILLTGWMTSDEQDPKIPASGVDAIMEKPAAPSQLVKKIQELVSSRPLIHGSG